MKSISRKYPTLQKIVTSAQKARVLADFGLDGNETDALIDQAYLLVQKSNERIRSELKKQGLDPYTESHPGAFVKAKNPQALMQFIQNETLQSLAQAHDLLEQFGVDPTDQNIQELVGFMTRMAHEIYIAH
jgi:acyl-homoserine lactone acylase PvdQ